MRFIILDRVLDATGSRTGSRMIVLLGAACLAAGALWAAVPGFVGSSAPRALEVTGISGTVGEWEVSAKLTRNDASAELSGPLEMTHIGWCAQDGPEKKSGEMRVSFARFSSRIDAKLVLEGTECSFRGSLSDAYTGTLVCPQRRPVPLILWLR